MQTILSLDEPLPACSGLLLALLLLVLLDYITGVWVAIQTKTLSRSEPRALRRKWRCSL